MARRRKSSVFRPLVAGVAAAFVDGFALTPLTSSLGLSDDVARMLLGGAGLMFARNKMLRDVAQAELVIGAHGFGRGLAGGALSSGSSAMDF